MLTQNSTRNPFRQTAATWLISLSLPYKAVEFFAETLSEYASSTSFFEKETSDRFESKPDDTWVLNLYCEEKPELDPVQQASNILAEAMAIPAPELTLSLLPDHDWVSEVQKHFPPLAIGRYFVYGSHYEEPLPASSIPIKIDAGRAFGTGEHETTSSCLKALEYLRKKRLFHGRDARLLDMGCGSGILAIAMAKSWHRPVLAADIDHQAVKITRENSTINRTGRYLRCEASNGYKAAIIRQKAPYDLIVANILARPLVLFAKDLAANLAPNGVAVLSGLLGYQEKAVLAAHRLHGLYLVKRIKAGHWHTLVLARSG